jgi:hypothetical protein
MVSRSKDEINTKERTFEKTYLVSTRWNKVISLIELIIYKFCEHENADQYECLEIKIENGLQNGSSSDMKKSKIMKS